MPLYFASMPCALTRTVWCLPPCKIRTPVGEGHLRCIDRIWEAYIHGEDVSFVELEVA